MSDLILAYTVIIVSVSILPFAIREAYRTIKEEFIDRIPSKIKLTKKKAGFYTGVGNLATY